MTYELYELLIKLANMRHPSVAGLLKKYGFGYEANIVEDLVQQFDAEKHEICECDNTHEQNNTVCRFCYLRGRRHYNDPELPI